jgi:hypothetical protein
MFAFFASILFFIAFILIGAQVAVSTAWFTAPALIALGLCLLAIEHYHTRIPRR